MFPKNGVRFIAVNNSIDSDSLTDNNFTPFLNIMNEWYAKDTATRLNLYSYQEWAKENDGEQAELEVLI